MEFQLQHQSFKQASLLTRLLCTSNTCTYVLSFQSDRQQGFQNSMVIEAFSCLTFDSAANTLFMAQTVTSLPAMEETRTQPLGREDPLQKGMATYSSVLAWRIPWTEEPGGLHGLVNSCT